jgi:hypothetical protein
MAQTITDFYRVAQQRGFSRDYMLRVLEIGDARFNEDDFLYITTKQLPNRTIANQTAPYMGLVFNVPGTAVYAGSDAWVATFRNDIRGDIRSKFEAWQRQDIFDDQSSTGNINVPGPDRYIVLQQVDDKLVPQNTYKLWGVYIKELGTVAYDAQGNGALTTFEATLAYQYWTHIPTDNININAQVTIPGFGNVNVGVGL